jgi:molybdate transport system substrate-binding protein
MRQSRRNVLLLFFCVGLFGTLLACSNRSQPQNSLESGSQSIRRTIRVAAAADLKFAMDELISAFHHEEPQIAVTVSYGSSGNFYSQLSSRAPFDMYFSADVSYPRRLAEQGAAYQGSEFAYAIGRLVVWVPAGSPIDVAKMKIEALRHPSVRHVAVANPKHAPYGRAAEAAMRSLGVYETVADRLVYGENVAQTLQFVQSGAAEIGIVALSLALAPSVHGQGHYWEIPLDSYPRMEQGGIILKWTQQAEAAQSFRSFALAPAGRQILKNYGFYLPEE